MLYFSEQKVCRVYDETLFLNRIFKWFLTPKQEEIHWPFLWLQVSDSDEMPTDLWSSLRSIFVVYRRPWKRWVLCCFTHKWFLKGRISNLPSTLLFRETKLFLLPPVGNNLSVYLIHSNFDDTASQVFRWLLGFSFLQYNVLLCSFRSCKDKIRDSGLKILLMYINSGTKK